MHSSKNIDTCSRNSETGPRGILYTADDFACCDVANIECDSPPHKHNALECHTSVELYYKYTAASIINVVRTQLLYVGNNIISCYLYDG